MQTKELWQMRGFLENRFKLFEFLDVLYELLFSYKEKNFKHMAFGSSLCDERESLILNCKILN